MNYKPRDLFPETLRVAKAFIREYDQARGDKEEVKKGLCHKYEVPEREAFRWIHVVRPYFQSEGDSWPFYEDIQARALDPSAYEDEARVDGSVLGGRSYSGPADQPNDPLGESPLASEEAETGSPPPPEDDTVTVESRNELAEMIGADPSTVWRGVDQNRRAKGYPVHEWVRLNERGHIDHFEVPASVDFLGGTGQSGPDQSGPDPEDASTWPVDPSEFPDGFFYEGDGYGGPKDLKGDRFYLACQQIHPGVAEAARAHSDPIRGALEAVKEPKRNPHFDPKPGAITPKECLCTVYKRLAEPGPSAESHREGSSEDSGGEEEQSRYDEWQAELSDIRRDGDPDPSDLTDRERYIATKLQKSQTIEGLVDDLGTRPSVLKRHLKDLKQQGWSVYFDSSAEMVAIEGDTVLRSSEHKGTRTRKANRWHELRHNELVRRYRGIEVPDAGLDAEPGKEDWVTHLTDLHAGDKVRREDGTVIYETEDIPEVIDYITDQSLSLAQRHNADYDDAHILWGGDMVTNEGIYEGQFEDLDAWLDEQIDILVSPLTRQIKAFSQSDQFDTVQVVCVVGNHGENRASATSRQANADLILYKFIRNSIAELNEHAGILDNVKFRIGQGQSVAYRNFGMRGGKVRGHLRHGQNRDPQAKTSARKKEWQATYIDHDFDVAYMGHHHVTGRIPWNGPPIISSSSPKPAGEFVERIGEKDPEGDYQDVATAHGISDDGLTCVYPIDTRNYEA